MSDDGGMRVVAGSPTPDEIAAVTAVLQAVADEEARRGAHVVVTEAPSGWARTARPLRAPLDRGPGAWTRSLR